MATDLVLTFYATKNIAGCPIDTCSEPLGAFSARTERSPRDDLRGTYGGWAEAAQAIRDPVTKRVLPRLLREACAKTGIGELGRVAVIGFSEGVQMLTECLRSAEDREGIDTVIDLDGLHMPVLQNGAVYTAPMDSRGYFPAEKPGLGPWIAYGQLCKDAQRLLVNWHTQVPTPNLHVTSTTVGCDVLYGALSGLNADGRTQRWSMDDLRGPPFDPPARTPAQNDAAREWTEMPKLDVMTAGNCFQIGMPGNSGGAHIFTCHWGQAAIWRSLLVPRWNGTTTGDAPAGAGGGQPLPVQTTLVDGAYLQPESAESAEAPSHTTTWIVLGSVAVAATAFWAYSRSRR